MAVDQYKKTKKTRQIIAGDVTLWRGGGRQSAGRVTHFHSIYLLLDTYGLGFARKIYLGGWPLSIVAVWESGGCQKISQSHLLTDDGRTLGRVIRAALTQSKYFPKCVFMCIRTLNNVDNTEPRKYTLRSKPKKGAKLYLGCFDSVRKHKHYWNKWIVDDCWIDIINERLEIATRLQV